MRKILAILISIFCIATSQAKVICGADCTNEWRGLLKGKRVALLANHTATTEGKHILDKMLEEQPRDLVIVDAFADIYTGPMNENNRVRSFVNHFSQLVVKHSTLIIFLHHTGKRTESLAPSKHNAIGSQGFEAKMRLMMELRPDPERHDIRHLCIAKGNYLAESYKHDSFELRFTAGLNFEATGERVPFALLRERSDEPDDRVELARAMREEGKSYRQIAEELGYKSGSAIHYMLSK